MKSLILSHREDPSLPGGYLHGSPSVGRTTTVIVQDADEAAKRLGEWRETHGFTRGNLGHDCGEVWEKGYLSFRVPIPADPVPQAAPAIAKKGEFEDEF